MRLIDTHCHIQFDAYDADRDDIIRKCHEKEIGLLVVGCDEESSRKALELVSSLPKEREAWCAVGQHPTDTGKPFDYKTFYDLARSSKKVVAIGECGLDYYRIENQESRIKEMQKDLFFQHLNLAHELHLPLIIHCRNAHEDMIEALMHRYRISHSEQSEPACPVGRESRVSQNHRDPSVAHRDDNAREHGVLHCFTGTAIDAQSYLDLGFMISFTGIVTFTKQYDDIVSLVPLEKMLIETDSPFLTPAPHRGQRNSPEYVEYVARRIGEIKGVPAEEVWRVTTENAKRLFGI